MKKIPTIFKRDPNDMKNVLNEPNPDCSWVFDGEGIATRKYDGTCCMIEDGRLYKRREVKNGQKKPPMYREVDFDQNTGKSFGWVPCDAGAPEDKYHIEAYADLCSKDYQIDGTYELVGPKIQGNPENYGKHVLIKHSEIPEIPDVPRDFRQLSNFLRLFDIEGIVFHHPDGRMAKIKKRDFGLKRGL